MKLNWIIGGAIVLSVVSCGGDSSEDNSTNDSSAASSLSTELDSVSYALGLNIADNFTKQKVKGLSGTELAKGYSDFNTGTTKFNEAQSSQVLQDFMMKHQTAMQTNPDMEMSYETSLMDSVSYALGINVCQSFKQQGVEGLKANFIGKGFSEVNAGTAIMNETEALNVLKVFGEKQQAIAAEKAKLDFAANIEEGEKFLAENGKRPEVTTLPSGLQYEIIKEGKGEIPTMMNTVSTHYHGTLINGTVFDSSIERGAPIEFGVGGVIAGWTEALKLMPVGSKWKLYIPYNLAYGERGSGPKIGPFSTLIFDIELLAIVK